MNWKLILQLSLFGLAMGVATVFVIASNVEPLFWLVIFVICAYIIATRAPGRYFLHGLMVSIFNSVWITAAHIAMFDRYLASHPEEARMTASMPVPARVMMALLGPVIGVVSGVVLGLFAVVAARLVVARRRQSVSGR
jgi:hypothetical protein